MSNILVSNYSVKYQIMNSVSIYGILPIKDSLNTPSPSCASYFRQFIKRPAVVSRHIWTQFSNVPFFNLGNILM
jgi:hypothetical protein